VATATEAARLAAPEYRSHAFTAGLLSDVGLLLLAAKAPELIRRDEAELGFTHGGLGAYLLGLWGLAPGIVEAVAFHHEVTDGPVAGDGGLGTRQAVGLAVESTMSVG
jgi:HD-like signal output (HDOD) protein